MFEWFKRKRPVQVENIGPDAPKVKLPARIEGYSLDGDALRMTLVIGGKHTIVVGVPAAVPAALPVGTEVRLVMEKT